jgi:hypothetical protein
MGMGLTDRACEAKVKATSRQFICSCTVTLEHDSIHSRNRGSDSPSIEQYLAFTLGTFCVNWAWLFKNTRRALTPILDLHYNPQGEAA